VAAALKTMLEPADFERLSASLARTELGAVGRLAAGTSWACRCDAARARAAKGISFRSRFTVIRVPRRGPGCEFDGEILWTVGAVAGGVKIVNKYGRFDGWVPGWRVLFYGGRAAIYGENLSSKLYIATLRPGVALRPRGGLWRWRVSSRFLIRLPAGRWF